MANQACVRSALITVFNNQPFRYAGRWVCPHEDFPPDRLQCLASFLLSQHYEKLRVDQRVNLHSVLGIDL